MITYLRDENKQSEKKFRKHTKFNTPLKAFGIFDIIANTFTSVALSFEAIDSIFRPTSTEVACGLTISKKVAYEIVM